MRKRGKKIAGLAITMLLTLAMPINALAATHTVTSSNDILEKLDNDTDTEITFILSGENKTYEQLELYLAEGKTITINGVGYTIEGLGIQQGLNLQDVDTLTEGLRSNVNVNANVSDYLGVGDKVTAVIKGSIEGIVVAQDESDVTVEGNITSENSGIHANGDSKVTVTGDITAANTGVDATGNTNVTVNGNVTGGEIGVNAYKEEEEQTYLDIDTDQQNDTTEEKQPTVTVNGDVIGGTNADIPGVGVSADDATVNVNGNVYGADGDLDEASKNYSDGSKGIEAWNGANVTVTGNVEGGDAVADGIYAEGGAGIDMDSTSNVQVGGNVTGGNATNEEDNKVMSDIAGNGVTIRLDVKPVDENIQPGKLVIGGKVTGGASENENSVQGAAIYLNTDEGDEGDEFVIPEMTVWGLTSPEETFQGDEGAEELIASLYADVNYLIRITQPENGTVTTDKPEAKAGETVIVTPKANDGYRLGKVLLNDTELQAVDGVYSFVVPEDGLVVVSAQFEKINTDKLAGTTGTIKTETVQTGDTAMPMNWLLLMGVSMVSAVSVFVKKSVRKK